MLNRMKIIGLALFITAAGAVALLALPAAAATSADETVVAIVNGDKILKKEVMQAVEKLPVKDVQIDKIFPFVVDQMINEKLIDSATASANVEDTPEFKKRMELVKAQLVKQLYLENTLKDKVSDKAVEAEYEKFKKENKGKEEVRARHILVPTEEEAKQVIKDLEAGQKFDELAAKRSSDPSNAQSGGDLGYFLKEEMVPEFSEAAFSTKPGTYTKTPVKSSFGWHIIKVEDKRTRAVPELKEVEMAIRNKLGQDALQKLVQDLRAKAEIQRFNLDGSPVEETKKN